MHFNLFKKRWNSLPLEVCHHCRPHILKNYFQRIIKILKIVYSNMKYQTLKSLADIRFKLREPFKDLKISSVQHQYNTMLKTSSQHCLPGLHQYLCLISHKIATRLLHNDRWEWHNRTTVELHIDWLCIWNRWLIFLVLRFRLNCYNLWQHDGRLTFQIGQFLHNFDSLCVDCCLSSDKVILFDPIGS